jgi:acetyl esterase/lipase
MLVGHSPGIDHNEFLATKRAYGDFNLRLSFRMLEGKGNSGVQFRSVRVPGHEMSGYQADLGDGYWGSLYDESRRNKTLVAASAEALRALNKNDWNDYVVRARGDAINLSLNGKESVAYRETDTSIARDGLLAVQIHAGGPMEVQFKDMYIQPLPIPTTDVPFQPGFMLKKPKTGGADREYAVYLPAGYDGTRPFPVILFLHGAAHRGSDGVAPAQMGIGPALLNRPGGVPALVVMPQARETWDAGTADSEAALKVLDDVLASYKVDPKRVILTGVSMGGKGSWSLAASHPERFAAVVPICGQGNLADVPQLKGLPVWSFCGDADDDALVVNMRQMVEALRTAGGTAKITEYRGVGHRSWDRVYNDPEVLNWMLAQSKP